MNFTEFRLMIRHAINKYRKIILIAILIICIVVAINMFLKLNPEPIERETTYEPHQSIMDSTVSTPKSVQDPIEEMIAKYVKACNDADFPLAFSYLSEDCRKFAFNNDLETFKAHVFTKIPLPKEYSIQSYSTMYIDGNRFYIYEVKYTDDLLASGLTNAAYAFTSEKMTFYYDNNELMMTVGDYIYHNDIKSMSENEYMKVDVIDKTVRYSTEEYTLRITNKSEHTIVIADGEELEEIVLQLPNEQRKANGTRDIVLEPNTSMEYTFSFQKFVDDGDESSVVRFNSVRVMDQYSGTEDEVPEEVRKAEIDNAVAKFTMEVSAKG